MRARLATRFVLLLGLLLAATGSAVFANPGGRNSQPPLIPGSRQVHIRNSAGGLGTYTSIPSGSTFRTHGGGSSARCSGVSPGDDPATLAVVEDRQPIESTRWIFIEGVITSIDLPGDLETFDPEQGGSIEDVRRTFSVYCNDTYYSANFLGLITVSGTDPMLDPRGQITDLYNGLQLEDMLVYRNQVVDTWGGLVVRNPAWLAVNSSSWRTQRSNPAYYRGWTLYLILQPQALEFDIDFTPDPERPSEPFIGTLPCLGAGEGDAYAVVDGAEFPLRPTDLPDFAETGQNQPCEWTPPGPGEVTITARQTFTVTFWANGATQAQPDYTWESAPFTYQVGELVAVNVNE